MKKRITLTIALGMILVGTTGCSSPSQSAEAYSRLQKDYDSVCSQLADALDQVYELKDEVSSLNSEIDQYKAQLAAQDEQSVPLDSGSAENTLVFDDMEITVSMEEIYLTKDEQRSSDYFEQPIVVVPMLVKNCSEEAKSLNHFYVKYYGAQGKEMDMLYFDFDDGMDIYTSLRPGASIEGNFYMVYDGDGDYYISFYNFSEKKEIAIPVLT